MGLYFSFIGNVIEMVGCFGGLVLFMLVVWLLVNGQKVQYVYEVREIVKFLVFFCKISVLIVIGLVVVVIGLFGFMLIMNELVSAAIYVVMAALLYGISFGLDLMWVKGLEGYLSYDV